MTIEANASDNRIDALFAARDGGDPELVCFLTAGDPGLESTVPAMHALVRGGASMLELGMPFSDPMADGPVIQAASERALARGADMSYVLRCVEEFRGGDQRTPVVLMGYLNPIERFGFERFCEEASKAGVDALLIVDLPPEECRCVTDHSAPLGMKQIFLVAPTTSAARLDAIAEAAGGFIYYVSLKGITGAANLDTSDVARRVASIRERSDLPVAVGFGVKTRADVSALAGVADAVVVGSALVQSMHDAGADAANAVAEHFARELTGQTDSPAPPAAVSDAVRGTAEGAPS